VDTASSLSDTAQMDKVRQPGLYCNVTSLDFAGLLGCLVGDSEWCQPQLANGGLVRIGPTLVLVTGSPNGGARNAPLLRVIALRFMFRTLRSWVNT
jgi:hypothetical protein